MAIKVTILSVCVLGSSRVTVNGKEVYVEHSHLISKNGCELHTGAVDAADLQLTRHQTAAVRAAIEAEAARTTEQYRNLRNAKKVAA